MRLIFAGTPEFAQVAMAALHAERIRIPLRGGHVEIRAPLASLIVGYRGWLVESSDA